ncbi:MAG: hypothetical protein ACYC99_17565, partial [Candidatus Geothermincolia bacterium]
ACNACNSLKSSRDSFLRDFLVADAQAPASPIADEIHPRYLRAKERGRSELWKEILSDRTPKIYCRGTEGQDLGMNIMLPAGKGPMKEIITFIAKGLYYKMLTKRIPDNHNFLVGFLPSRQVFFDQYDYWTALGFRGGIRIGDSKVFACYSFTAYLEEEGTKAEVGSTIWGLAFYDRTFIACISIGPWMRKRCNPALLSKF